MGAWILYALAVALALALLTWKKWKVILPASWQGAVTTAIGTASGVVSDAAADAALQSLVMLAWVHDDLAMITKLGEVKLAIQKWSSPPAVAPPSSDYAMDTLRAQVAALTRVVASQSTSTIPTAATVQP